MEQFCDWCDGGACDLVFGNDFHCEIDDGVLFVYHGLQMSMGRKIKYCPMCGKKFREEQGG